MIPTIPLPPGSLELDANIGILQVSRVLRDPSIFQTGLVAPLGDTLSLPGPLEPATGLFIGNDLGLPVLAHEFPILFVDGRGKTRLALTASDLGRSWEGALDKRRVGGDKKPRMSSLTS